MSTSAVKSMRGGESWGDQLNGLLLQSIEAPENQRLMGMTLSAPNKTHESMVMYTLQFLQNSGKLSKEMLIKLLNLSIDHNKKFPNIVRIPRQPAVPVFTAPENKTPSEESKSNNDIPNSDVGTNDSNSDSSTDPNTSAKFSGCITVVGDVHGQYLDFTQLFHNPRLVGTPSESNVVVFNGDLVDRGPKALEIVAVLMLSQLLNPQSTYMLRGNHETTSMNSNYGFQKEVLSKYDHEVLDKFRELFQSLPLAAVLGEEIFVVHGGIGVRSAQMLLDEIDALNRFCEPSDHKGPCPMHEMLWSGKLLRYVVFLKLLSYLN
jgi:hypothetical protein